MSSTEAGPVQFGRWNQALMQLARSHRDIASARMAAIGLSAEQAALMMYLWSAGPVRQTELVVHFNRDSAAVTRIVQRLERGGILRRDPDPFDGRATLVVCTDAGERLRPLARQIWEELESAMLAAVTPHEASVMVDVLERLADAMTQRATAEDAGTDQRLT